MNNLQMFKSDEFGMLRGGLINNEPWFIGKDVVGILGYNLGTSYTNYIRRYCSEKNIINYNKETQFNFDINLSYKELSQRGGLLVNKDGLQDLMIKSSLPNTRAFKEWIIEEVLPQIKQVDDVPEQYEEEPVSESNELQIVDEREVLGRDFKIYGTVDEPLFLAKDVANWIEHSSITMMLKNIDEDEKVKIRPKQSLGLLTNNNEYWFLTEDGLYEVLMLSRKPIAKAFKKEVKKILKQIRQTGGYVPVSQEDDEEAILARALVIAEKTLSKKNKIIKELQPRANWFDDFMNSEGSYTSTQVAKLLNISSAKRLNKLLYENL